MKTFNANPIVNIVRAELVTEEQKPRVMCFETLSSSVPEPHISEGEESELRIRNTILAQEQLEDIIKGYNITLKDCVMSRELLEIIDGGECDPALAVSSGYKSPVAGKTSRRTHFTLNLYAAEKDYAGDSVAYFRFSFPNCVGTPAKFSLENGTFTTPEYVVRSRPHAGGHAMKVGVMDNLPIYCSAATDLPAEPEEGLCVVAEKSFVIGSMRVAAGQMIYYDGEKYAAAQ